MKPIIDKTKPRTKQELLQEVITIFGEDPQNRRSTSFFKNGDCSCGCKYFPPTGKPDSPGCGIGAFLEEDIAKKLDSEPYSSISYILQDPDLESLIPKWMINISDNNFLSSIQSLHDDPICWGEDKGVSQRGIEMIEEICNFNKLDFSALIFP